MKADPVGVATGSHYIDGDHACGEGAIAAGCRFLAGYPITPSTEVAERIAERYKRDHHQCSDFLSLLLPDLLS